MHCTYTKATELRRHQDALDKSDTTVMMNTQSDRIRDRVVLLERLKAEAEMEMRRTVDEGRPFKRQKHAAEGGSLDFLPLGRFRYSVVEDLEAGAAGFIITCNFRKEKSATREASQLLRRYLPAHLFPEAVTGNPDNGPRQQQQRPPPPQQQQGPWQQQQPLAGEVAGSGSGMSAGGEAASGGPCSAKNAAEFVVGGADAVVEAAGAAAAGAYEEDGDDSSSSSSDDEEEAGGPGGHDLAAADQGGPGGGTGGVGPGQPSALALAKVSCRGVVLMRLSAAAAEVDTVGVVAAMLRDLEAGAMPPPKHCQRIIPLDSTCNLTAAGLTRAVAQAAAAHRRRHQPSDAADAAAVPAPFTYAVVYRSRLVEGGWSEGATPATAATPITTAATAVAAAATPGSEAATGPGADEAVDAVHCAEGGSCGDVKEGDEALLFDRGRIISLVAAGMAAAFGESAKVHLKKPQVAVLVETVPVAGRPFAGLVLLGQQLFHAKGKILIKPLIKNAPSA